MPSDGTPLASGAESLSTERRQRPIVASRWWRWNSLDRWDHVPVELVPPSFSGAWWHKGDSRPDWQGPGPLGPWLIRVAVPA